jgi:hypothetical protein
MGVKIIGVFFFVNTSREGTRKIYLIHILYDRRFFLAEASVKKRRNSILVGDFWLEISSSFPNRLIFSFISRKQLVDRHPSYCKTLKVE